MITVVDNDIAITRGDTGSFKLNVKDINSATYNFSYDEVKFTVKHNAITNTMLFGKLIDSTGIIKILPTDTEGLDYGIYWYDVQIKRPNGDTYTVIPPHKFEITKEITFNYG